MKNLEATIAECIPDQFIYHKAQEFWGPEILIMEKSGEAFARLYWYDDDPKNAYLNWLSVAPKSRKHGLGTQLQDIREKIALELGIKTVWLQADETSWMHEWYKRRGYQDELEVPKEDNLVWMKKLLNS